MFKKYIQTFIFTIPWEREEFYTTLKAVDKVCMLMSKKCTSRKQQYFNTLYNLRLYLKTYNDYTFSFWPHCLFYLWTCPERLFYLLNARTQTSTILNPNSTNIRSTPCILLEMSFLIITALTPTHFSLTTTVEAQKQVGWKNSEPNLGKLFYQNSFSHLKSDCAEGYLPIE